MALKCKEISKHLEQLCPKNYAEEWDNVGLLVGDPEQDIEKVMVALDATEETIIEAIENKVNMIVTHHPLIMKPINRVTTSSTVGKLIQKLIKYNICLYSAHTNLDSAKGGINDVLVKMFELKNVKFLSQSNHKKLKKLVVFVPETHLNEVRDVLSRAGAGWIGNYSDCTYYCEGIGTFKGLDGTNPFIGKAGKLEKVKEYRLETIVSEDILDGVIKAMINDHPYEEVAYDIYPLENKGEKYGIGRIGELKYEIALSDFVDIVKEKLNIKNIRVVGNLSSMIKKVAICSGSGMSLLKNVIDNQANVYITGDVKYHDAQEALAHGISIIDAGHYETENIAMPMVKKHLDKLENLQVIQSQFDGNPFKLV